MKKLSRNLLLSILLLGSILAPFKTHASVSSPSKEISSNRSTCELRMEMRQLWTEHVLWTRSAIVSTLSSLEDANPVVERLLKNQDDTGNAFKPFYGDEIGNKIGALLREHIQLAGKVIDASKSGNKSDLEKYNKLWYENADQIASFLASINPNYCEKDLKDMLHKHLGFVTDQVVARLNKDWNADISAFDKGEEHMIKFADMLTDGLIKQFPKNFKK